MKDLVIPELNVIMIMASKLEWLSTVVLTFISLVQDEWISNINLLIAGIE